MKKELFSDVIKELEETRDSFKSLSLDQSETDEIEKEVENKISTKEERLILSIKKAKVYGIASILLGITFIGLILMSLLFPREIIVYKDVIVEKKVEVEKPVEVVKEVIKKIVIIDNRDLITFTLGDSQEEKKLKYITLKTQLSKGILNESDIINVKFVNEIKYPLSLSLGDFLKDDLNDQLKNNK